MPQLFIYLGVHYLIKELYNKKDKYGLSAVSATSPTKQILS